MQLHVKAESPPSPSERGILGHVYGFMVNHRVKEEASLGQVTKSIHFQESRSRLRRLQTPQPGTDSHLQQWFLPPTPAHFPDGCILSKPAFDSKVVRKYGRLTESILRQRPQVACVCASASLCYCEHSLESLGGKGPHGLRHDAYIIWQKLLFITMHRTQTQRDTNQILFGLAYAIKNATRVIKFGFCTAMQAE